MSHRVAAGLVALAGAASLAALLSLAPDYLVARGFPLDDAWTYAVYARSVALSGAFAYNPGIPATGAMSPLWTLVLAVPHMLASNVITFVLCVKLLGFALHVTASLLLLRALGDGIEVRPAQLAGALLVAFHPDLVSASMSGVEVPLANLAAVSILLAADRSSALLYGVVCFLAPLVRPELTVLCVAVPVALFLRRSNRRLGIFLGAAVIGSAASYALVGLRNLAVSGLALPAAFHTRMGPGDLGLIDGQVAGWSELLSQFAIADSSILLVAATLVAGRVLCSRESTPTTVVHAAAGLVSALAFCVLSFAVFPPLDADAFSSRRAVLPVLPLIIGSMPVLLCEILPRRPVLARPARLVRLAILVLLVASVLVRVNIRFGGLANDARNLDEVQVAIGKYLASAKPDQTVWALDAGAVRYFGGGFVVDLRGVNSAEMLGTNAAAFLAGHRPRYIQTEAEEMRLEVEAPERLQAIPVRTSPASSTTSQARPQQWIVVCSDPDVAGHVVMRDRRLPFRCAPPIGSRTAAAR
jgi:hypothetical protein